MSHVVHIHASDGDALRALSELGAALGRADLRAEAEALAERTAAGRFYVACVGQFKRGKSTLLNALVGRPILPMGIVPVTSAITVLRYGAEPRARVRFADGETRDLAPEAIARYVAEDDNPENALRVAVVEVALPSPLLASGLCLVDTPGIGSVFAGNSAVTRQFVPHIDAALVVLGADPPLSGDELDLLGQLGQHVAEMIFVLNKADRLGDDERRQAGDFARRLVAQRLGRPVGPLLEVSAGERLRGPETRDWRRLVEQLDALSDRFGDALVRAARTRGVALLRARLRHELDEQLGALTRPLAESQARIEALARGRDAAELALRELGHRLSAEQEQLARRFGERRDAFVAVQLPDAQRRLAEALRQAAAQPGPLRPRAVVLAQALTRERIEPQLRREEQAAEALYRDAMARFVGLAEDCVRQLAESPDGALPPALSLGCAATLATRSRFFLHPLLTIVPDGWSVRLRDRLRTRAGALAAVERAASAYLERLLLTNSARMQNDLIERTVESRRRLEAELRARLGEAATAAQRALERAQAHQARGAGAVRDELQRLLRLRVTTDTPAD